MYISIYIYVYIYIHTYQYISVNIYIYISIYISVYISIYIYIYISIYQYISVYFSIFQYISSVYFSIYQYISVYIISIFQYISVYICIYQYRPIITPSEITTDLNWRFLVRPGIRGCEGADRVVDRVHSHHHLPLGSETQELTQELSMDRSKQSKAPDITVYHRSSISQIITAIFGSISC